MCYGSFDSQFVHLIKSTVNNFGVQSNAIDKIYVYIPRSIKHMRLVILARKGISVVARVRWQKQTRYMCIFFVLNVAKHQKCFLSLAIYHLISIVRSWNYLFLEAHSFSGAMLSENCSFFGTDKVCRQISLHIFAPNGDYCGSPAPDKLS